MMSPQVKDVRRHSGTAAGLLVFLSAAISFFRLRLRPFAACALTGIPPDISLHFILNSEWSVRNGGVCERLFRY